eukprot:1196061-Prorocentrum_minimum.AAC.8
MAIGLPGRWRSWYCASPKYGSQVRTLARAVAIGGLGFDLRGGFLAVERGAGGLDLEDSAAFAFRGRQYLVTCTINYAKRKDYLGRNS